ncbi:MAG: hypothetical protein P4M05_28430 [Bradyrhizobium sp.]|nr:hypothetical protein [Bradyrhizobium sp.]
MGRNFIRACSLQIGSGGSVIDLSNLRIVFKISQTTNQSPNPARFRVYNCAPNTVATLKAKEGALVTFSAGYQDSLGVVYIGDAKQFVAGHETAVDSYVDIFCAGGDRAYNQARVTKTLAAGWTPQDKLNVALSAMAPFGVSMGLTNVDLSQPKYPRGIPMAGMARDMIREIAFTKRAMFSIQNNQLTIVNPMVAVQSSTIEMSPSTGMVGWAKQTPDGIIVKSFINSQLQPHVSIHLDQSAINEAERDNNPFASQASGSTNFNLKTAGVLAPDGIYRVIALDRSGDTRGQEWYDESICIAASGGSPTAAQLSQGLSLGSN